MKYIKTNSLNFELGDNLHFFTDALHRIKENFKLKYKENDILLGILVKRKHLNVHSRMIIKYCKMINKCILTYDRM